MNNPTGKEIAEQAALFVSTRLDTPPTLLEVAQYLSTNTRILKTVFKQHYGITLSTYNRELRLAKAKELLATTSLHIAEIATASGYSDGPGLTEAFIKAVGISPGRWRKAYNKLDPQ